MEFGEMGIISNKKWSRSQKRQLLLQKWSNQTAILICEYPYGNKHGCQVDEVFYIKKDHKLLLKWSNKTARLLF